MECTCQIPVCPIWHAARAKAHCVVDALFLRHGDGVRLTCTLQLLILCSPYCTIPHQNFTKNPDSEKRVMIRKTKVTPLVHCFRCVLNMCPPIIRAGAKNVHSLQRLIASKDEISPHLHPAGLASHSWRTAVTSIAFPAITTNIRGGLALCQCIPIPVGIKLWYANRVHPLAQYWHAFGPRFGMGIGRPTYTNNTTYQNSCQIHSLYGLAYQFTGLMFGMPNKCRRTKHWFDCWHANPYLFFWYHHTKQ